VHARLSALYNIIQSTLFLQLNNRQVNKLFYLIEHIRLTLAILKEYLNYIEF